MQMHPGPTRAQDLEHDLSLPSPVRFALRRMADAGWMQQEGKGVFTLTAQGENIRALPPMSEARRRQYADTLVGTRDPGEEHL
jgi:hypothetical protein